MKLKIYSVYDVKTQAFARPFFLHNDGEAVRVFSDNVNQPDSIINKNPLDFVLYCLGEFNDIDGAIVPMHATKVITATEVKEAQKYTEEQVSEILRKILNKLEKE